MALGRLLNFLIRIVPTIAIIIGVWSTFYLESHRHEALILSKLLHLSQRSNPNLKIRPQQQPPVETSELHEKGIFECKGAELKIPWEITAMNTDSDLCGVAFKDGIIIYLRGRGFLEHFDELSEFMVSISESTDEKQTNRTHFDEELVHHMLNATPRDDNVFSESPDLFLKNSLELIVKEFYVREGVSEILYLSSVVPSRTAVFLKASPKQKVNKLLLFEQKKLVGILVIEGTPRIEEVSFLVDNLITH